MTASGTPAAIRLEDIRACLEGVIPVGIATLAADGTPNVTYISQVHYVDPAHVALTYQFFNKTRANLIANPVAVLQLIDRVTARTYRLTIRYEDTRTEGPLFESMRAKLAGIASHTGMAGVFRLAGADVCRVERIEALPGDHLTAVPEARSHLAALRRLAGALAGSEDLDAALLRLVGILAEDFRIDHGAVLLLDPDGCTLYTVSTHGYEVSGIGAEIAVGEGVIGMAARERVPIRISHMTSDVNYARGVGARLDARALDHPIPLPGLASPGSQLAVPIEDGQGLLGVLFVESAADFRFTFDDEDALVVVAGLLAGIVRRAALDVPHDRTAAVAQRPATRQARRRPLDIRHYRVNDSVFLGDDYLIKGVAGAIFWLLLAAFEAEGRVDFTNRELRLHPALNLPAYAENLEARLILLERRLAEKAAGIAIEKTGRGRLRLRVDRPVRLVEMPG